MDSRCVRSATMARDISESDDDDELVPVLLARVSWARNCRSNDSRWLSVFAVGVELFKLIFGWIFTVSTFSLSLFSRSRSTILVLEGVCCLSEVAMACGV